MTPTELFSERWPHRIRQYKRGTVIYWQGDPTDLIFFILEGVVKISSIFPDGKIFSIGVRGSGRLLGAKSYLLGGDHESVAEVLEPAKIITIPVSEFEKELSKNTSFSSYVMKELAREARDASSKARDLSFLDVQQRLKHSLMKLANEHGIQTEKGVLIDLNITQEEMGALVAANRTTISSCLSQLRDQGYIWKEGRRLVIIPPKHMELLDNITRTIINGDEHLAEKLANQAINENIDPLKALESLIMGMKHVDRAYSRGELDLPDVVLAASAMKRSLPIIEANIELERKQETIIGTVVIGTVLGDIHDIGKTIVAMLMRARNFRVIDLGVNISPEHFINAIVQFNPDILALSALTTTTSLELSRIVRILEERSYRNKIKLMVGGGGVGEEQASNIGADGYHISAQGAVEVAWQLCTWN